MRTELIEPVKKLKTLRANAVFLSEGQEPAMVGLVVEGVMRITQTTQDGRHQILGLHMPSDFFGHLFSHSSGFGLECATDAQICTFDRDDFEHLIDAHPRLGHAVLLATSDQLSAARNLTALLGAHRATERIARFYLACSRLDRSDNSRKIHVPIGRRDLAALLNTTPETICRFVKDMVRKRILSVRGANDFAILAVDRLEQVAGKSLVDEVNAIEVPSPAPRAMSFIQSSAVAPDASKMIRLKHQAEAQDLRPVATSKEFQTKNVHQ